MHSEFQTKLPLFKLTPNSKTSLRIRKFHSHSPGTGTSLCRNVPRDINYLSKMVAGNSTSALKCEVCTTTLTIYNKFCSTCGAELDEEKLALKYYFNEGYEYEVILCFLQKYHGIQMSLQTLKDRFRSFGLR